MHIDYIVEGARLEEVLPGRVRAPRALRCDQATLDREAKKVDGEIDAVLNNPKGELTKFR